MSYVSDALIDAQGREIEKLKTENAKLRAERDYLLINSNPTAAELRRVRSAWKKDREENAKLRELIADVHEALRADKAGMFHKLILASMEDDMQKLGIEEVPHD